MKIGFKHDITNWLMTKGVGALGVNGPQRKPFQDKMYKQWLQWRMFELVLR